MVTRRSTAADLRPFRNYTFLTDRCGPEAATNLLLTYLTYDLTFLTYDITYPTLDPGMGPVTLTTM